VAISNCKSCGRIFNRVRRDICLECIAEEDRAYLSVREYIRNHRDADMAEIVEKTGVGTETIIQLIQDGRLILVDNPNIHYGCARCGEPTQSGKYCSSCAQTLVNALSTASEEIRNKLTDAKKKDGGGYYSR